MKNNILLIFSWLCFSAFLIEKAVGGDTLVYCQEKVILLTDRTFYITGENISFSAFRQNDQVPAERILYVEIIAPDGGKIIGSKYLFDKGMAIGCLPVPQDVLTGLYYIRAYSRSMRNDGPSVYGYVPIKLINPFKTEVLSATGIPLADNLVNTSCDSLENDFFEILTDNVRYKTRDRVELKIRSANPEPSRTVYLCVSVAAEGTMHTTIPGKLLMQNGNRLSHEFYQVENEGLSLSGKVTDITTAQMVPGVMVTLSVIGDKDFSAFITDRNGRFFFTLPDYSGSRDVFLSSAGLAGIEYNLLIDNDFCTVPIKLPNSSFILSEAEKEIAYKLAVNCMVADQYKIKRSAASVDSLQQKDTPFYGQPTETLFMDKFIQLPTLEEYFNELPLEVKVRDRKEGKYFKFLSQNATMTVYDPLVMVDWVVISDIGKVLSLSPQKIDRIEIVNKPYVKGNLTFGGVISIISRQGDFAGIDLPGSGLFLRYDFLSPACEFVQSVPEAANQPDTRNTVLWIPSMQPGGAGESTVSFSTPDTPGRYEILVRAVLPDSRIISRSVFFEVKD